MTLTSGWKLSLNNVTIGTKIRLGMVSLAILAGVVGAVGYRGLILLGGVVDQTAAASDVMTGVNTASSNIAAFVLSPTDIRLTQASTALSTAEQSAEGIGNPAEIQQITATIDAFKAAIDKLGQASRGINEASDAMTAATNTLVDLANDAEKTSAKKAEDAEKESSATLIDLQNIQGVSFGAGKIAAAAYEIRAALNAYAGQPDRKWLAAAQASIVKSRPAMQNDLVSAGWVETQKSTEKLSQSFAALDTALTNIDNLDGPAIERAVASAQDLADASGAFLDIVSQLAKADNNSKKLHDDERSKARVIAGMVRNFGDKVKAATIAANRFRLAPSDENATATRKALDQAGSFGKMLDRMGRPELKAGLTTAIDAFEKLVLCKTSFDSTVETTLATAKTTSAQVADLAHGRQLAAQSQEAASTVTMIATGLASISFAVIFAFLLARVIANPIRLVTVSMQRLAKGDTEVILDERKRGDEIGEMISSVAIFRDNAIERRRLSTERAGQQDIQNQRQARIETLIHSFRAEMSSILSAVTNSADQMQETASSLSRVAEGSSGQAHSASHSAREASGSVQTVAASAEELSSSIAEIGSQVEGTMKIVQSTSDNASTTAAKTAALMNAATKIGDVISLIRSIAGQTNLLALNATIEAARAGDSGKGFAVVAGEVKLLANQTSKATDEITAQIEEIQISTQTVVEAIQAISARMGDVTAYTTSIAASVEEQGLATAEIARSVVNAASGTDAASSSVDLLTHSVEETSKSASHVLQVSRDLNAQAAKVSNVLEKFLQEVSAA